MHEAPKDYQRWVQTRLIPAECFRVEVVVHQRHPRDVWSYDLEVSDPHTGELMARLSCPWEPYSEVLTLTQQVSVEMRACLQALLDPDPF
jgi:hypothetical protein